MRNKSAHLGNRRVCSSCDTKYYDLNRSDPTCPRCGAPADVEEVMDPRAAAMARLKADNQRARPVDEDEEVPFGLNEEEDAAAEDEEMDDLGEFTEETSEEDDDEDEGGEEEGAFEDFDD
jgi:uncharacterized protein (TIGR02300 family)